MELPRPKRDKSGIRPDARPRPEQRYSLQLEWVINKVAEIDHYQPILFIVDSFDHLFELVDRLERWMREGKLNNVAPGLPEVNEGDLRSFMDAGRRA